MNKFIAFIIIFFSLSLAKGQYKETRKIENHEGISVSIGLNTIYIESDRNEVVIECENKEHLRLISTEVKNNILNIAYTQNNNTLIITTKPNKVTIYSNSKLNTLNASTGALLQIERPIIAPDLKIFGKSSAKIIVKEIQADKVEINLNSSAKFEAYISAKNTNINTLSSSKITLNGKVENVTINMSSSATIDLLELAVENLTCNGTSTAILNMNTSNTLKSSLSSSAKIFYTKEPSKILENITYSNGALKKKK